MIKQMSQSVTAPMLAAFLGSPHDPYTPHLSLVRHDERFVWVCDNGVRIGLIDQQWASIEWLAPHPGEPSIRPAEMPPLYHAPTFQGGRLICQWWLTNYGGWRTEPNEPLAPPVGVIQNSRTKLRPQCEWQWLTQEGKELRFIIDQSFAEDASVRGQHDVTLRYDPATNSYVADVEMVLDAAEPYYAEALNLYTAGLYDTRPERKRYQWTCWSHPSGRQLRFAHSPVHVLTPGLNDSRGVRRIASPGFIGFYSDPHSNPTLQIHEANCKLSAATCCNLYDEHLVCLPSSEKPSQYKLRCRFGSLPAMVAQKLVEDAVDIDLGTDFDRRDVFLNDAEASDDDLGLRIVHSPSFPSFRTECVNDFEEPIRAGELFAGAYIFASQSPQHLVYWDTQIGYSGGRSIRLRSDGGITETRNHGPTPHVEPDTHYTLKCYIRCRNLRGKGAMVALDQIGTKRQEAQLRHIAGPVRGDCDWTCVETSFRTASDTHLVWLRLVLDGVGEAWFDDLSLMSSAAPLADVDGSNG